MILKQARNNMIFAEFDEEMRANWFDMKDKKFLNTIDTLYYSVLVSGDFSPNTKDKTVLSFRRFWDRELAHLRIFDDYELHAIPGLPYYFQLRYCSFGGGTYEVCLSRPDNYDILIAKRTSNEFTSQFLVQLRSKTLWMDSVRTAIDNSLKDVEIIVNYFGFRIIEVKENRIDYCWHTNYLQNPQSFFLPDNFARMRLSRMSDSTMHIKYRGNEDYDIDYVTLGKKASVNVFFRIYLKSKEVIEKGYKAFFLKLWYLNGMINRYDLYCYEYAYEFSNWDYVNFGRLKFYLEFGTDKAIKFQCEKILEGEIKMKYDNLKNFADMITPSVTLVINVEYQTMRKFSQSIVLPDSIYNHKKYGVRSRLYDIVDNYRAIANYLTEHCVRLVQPYGDENKSRREDCGFWDCLRRSRSIDGKNTPADTAVIRQYDHERNAELVKKRALGSISSFNLYYKGENTQSSEQDLIDFISTLNDNDFVTMNRLKNKKMKRADYKDPLSSSMSDFESNTRYIIIDKNTGEILNNNSIDMGDFQDGY